MFSDEYKEEAKKTLEHIKATNDNNHSEDVVHSAAGAENDLASKMTFGPIKTQVLASGPVRAVPLLSHSQAMTSLDEAEAVVLYLNGKGPDPFGPSHRPVCV